MGFFDFLKGKQEKEKSDRKGEIGYLRLKEWFNGLSKVEKDKVRKYYSMGLSDSKSLESEEITFSTSNQQKFLGTIGQNALSQKDFSFAETILLEALQSKDDNPMDRHFVYNSLIDLYYKKRDSSDAIEKCIKYCLEDIKYFEDFKKAWEREFGDELPRIPSFERLAIIYEKQGKFEEAIEICQMALKLGLKSSRKGGFEGRINKLQKKLNKSTTMKK
ncbi:MAG: tetratricopeptide repeat protein [Archaeoglobaceae archaeon]